MSPPKSAGIFAPGSRTMSTLSTLFSPAVTEPMRLIGGQLCRGVAGREQHEDAGRDRRSQDLKPRKVKSKSRMRYPDHVSAPFVVASLDDDLTTLAASIEDLRNGLRGA